MSQVHTQRLTIVSTCTFNAWAAMCNDVYTKPPTSIFYTQTCVHTHLFSAPSLSLDNPHPTHTHTHTHTCEYNIYLINITSLYTVYLYVYIELEIHKQTNKQTIFTLYCLLLIMLLFLFQSTPGRLATAKPHSIPPLSKCGKV